MSLSERVTKSKKAENRCPKAPRELCFLLILSSLLPLKAQTSIDHSSKVFEAPASGPAVVAPAHDTTGTAVSSDITMPARALIQPDLADFTISPSTIREGLTYLEDAKTSLTLTKPAIKSFTCTVVSSDPTKLTCGAIAFLKGDQEGKGLLSIKWKNIDRDCEVVVKVFDPSRPETILRSRLYLRKGFVTGN
jgi:hypothetical protein